MIDGKITEIRNSIDYEGPKFNASGLYVVPGFIDLHTHLREPGEEHKETIATGAKAAVRGGFTTVCAMPNTTPTMDTAAVLGRVIDLARNVPVHVLPIGAITTNREGIYLAELSRMAESGAIAFSDDGRGVADGMVARRAFEYVSDLGLPIAEHCEDLSLSTNGVMHEGALSTRLGLIGQPTLAEVTMLKRDIQLAELSGTHLHVCHISTRESCEAVAEAKKRGVHITAEVTPHHLFLTDDAVFGHDTENPEHSRYNTNAKVNPPLRSSDDVLACITALSSGVIDAVATDHAPHSLPDKNCEFDQAAFGISGLETALGILGTLVQRGELSLETIISALTTRPAQAWNLESELGKGAGTLSLGAAADITLLNLDHKWTVDSQNFQSRGHNTPLDGVDLTGRVIATVIDGEVVYKEHD